MSIQRISDEALLVVVPKEPQLRDELAKINETVGSRSESNIIIDFSLVEIVTSSSISNLIILHNLLSERGRKLVLCNVALPTRGIFRTVGLENLFEFAADRSSAIAIIQGAEQLTSLRTAGKEDPDDQSKRHYGKEHN
jgi:anti-anti-sigma regulatory factor